MLHTSNNDHHKTSTICQRNLDKIHSLTSAWGRRGGYLQLVQVSWPQLPSE